MTQEQHKYYSNGYDDGKQSVVDKYVQILLKKDQEIDKLTEQNHKLMMENDTVSEELGETRGLLEACKRGNELLGVEIDKLKAENEKIRFALENLVEDIKRHPDDTRYAMAVKIATEELKKK